MAHEQTIYVSFGVFKNVTSIKFDKWDKTLSTIAEELGFNLKHTNRYRYVNTILKFIDDCIYKL
jgi:hypothetical protein